MDKNNHYTQLAHSNAWLQNVDTSLKKQKEVENFRDVVLIHNAKSKLEGKEIK